MGLMSFIKSAGEKLFHHKDAEAAHVAAAAAPDDETLKANAESANETASQAIIAYIRALQLTTKEGNHDR